MMKKSAPRRAMREIEELLTFAEEAGPIRPGHVVYMDASSAGGRRSGPSTVQ